MKANKYLIIAINIAALMVLMDLSAINIALPSIRQHFSLSVTIVSFILMASMLTATGFALIMGKIIERYRPGKILTIAFLVFGLTSTLTAFSSQFYFIIILRLIQGIAEAALYVIGPALIKKYIEQNKQQKEYGKWMMSCGLGISLGPVIGGLLIKYFAWNFVFLINAPLAILGIIYSRNLDKHLSFNKQKSIFDYGGAIYSFLFLSFLIIFFNLISVLGISNPLLWGTAILSFVFLSLFIRREKKNEKPIINLNLFKINNFRLAGLGFYLFFLVNVGSRFLRPFFFEEARGLSSTTSGLLMMISPGIMLVVSFFIHYIERYFSTKQLVITGSILLSISMFMFSFWTTESSLFFIESSMIILGLAMGVYYPTTTQLGMRSLPNGNHGTGSAIISISKSFGKLMGVLMFGLLFQLFYDLIIEQEIITISIESKAIQYVFIAAFIVSLINTFISFRIKNSE